MASQPSHRRAHRGTLSVVLRLAVALALAFMTLPALNTSAFADDVAPDPVVVAETPSEDPAAPVVIEPDDPVGDPVAQEDPVVEADPGTSTADTTSASSAPKSPQHSTAKTGSTTLRTTSFLVAASVTDTELNQADYIVQDENGANDEPGQKDLTQFFGFTAPVAGSVKIGWSWDEIAWSGNNTGDACALFDIDANGKADYAVCVTVTGDPATQLDIQDNPSPRLYSCNDTRVDRCAGPTLIASGSASSVDCEVSQTNTDPFANGDAKPQDTSALCTIPLSLFSGGGTPKLINVCSYPSQEPNSDPSDCVLIPRDALLTVNKVVTPLAAADSTSFGFTFTGASAPAPFSLQAGGTTTIPVRSGSALSLAEDTITGWRLVSATCTNGQEPSALKLASEATVTCTFTNTPRATVTVNKSWVINGTSYTNANKPTGYSATLTLTGQTSPTFGTTYSGYSYGDSVTIGESVTVPSGCTNSVGAGNLGAKTLGAGDNTYTVTNTVTCAATVTVNKSWVINGTSYTNANKPTGYSATLTLTGQNSPTFGTKYTGYTEGDSVTVGESVNIPDGCTNQTSGGGIGAHTLAKGDNVYSITNTVTCAATVTVTKSWVINGTSYTNANKPAGYSASLTLTGQTSPAFGTTYGGYTQGDLVSVGENVTVPPGCSNVASGVATHVLDRGANTYTITNTVNCAPGWNLSKTSNPVSGSTVEPGDSVTYTLHATNTSFGVVAGATVTDNLVDVLDNATLQSPLAAGLSISGTTLTWAVPTLQPGQSATVSYTVTVSVDQWNATLRNVVTPNGSGGSCTPAADCTTEHFTPAWTLKKSSDPATGSSVAPGETVTYTLTATNTSLATVVGATATDDLSDVLDNATIDGAGLAAGLSLAGTTMTWAIPTLAPGLSATVSYTVTVSADQWDATLRNVVTPNGLGGECTVLSDCTTEHFTPAWALTKSSDPVSGSEVEPGDDIVYTLTATNTSDATVEGAKAEDDLAEVLNNATLDEAALDAELSLSGTTLTWAIPTLLPGESASVSYTVTVDTDAFNVILENVVVPVGAGGVCVEDADCTTTHDTPEVLGEEVIRPRPPVVAGVELPSTGAPENGGLFGLLGAVTVGLGALLISADRRRRQT